VVAGASVEIIMGASVWPNSWPRTGLIAPMACSSREADIGPAPYPECVKRYDSIVATAATADELRAGFGAAMAGTLREDGSMHRLWYDLRNQSLFDEAFRSDAKEIDRSLERMIWRIVSRFAELAGKPPAVTPSVAYALADGLFQHALLAHLSGDAAAADELSANVRLLLPSLLA
jgi:hypothetical protein